MPLDFWMKGYLAMGTVMLIQSCITATKTLRDVHETWLNSLERGSADQTEAVRAASARLRRRASTSSEDTASV
jgi:hypothetical protein